MQAQVLGLSVDSTDCLRAWSDSLGGISYPLLSDFYPHGGVAELYGVLRDEGYSERTIIVIDKQGVIRYVDVHDKDSQPDNDELFGVLKRIEPAAAAVEAAAVAAQTPETDTRPDAEIIMYCTSWCPACRRARDWFKVRGISYLEIDITKDRVAAQRVKGWANGYETTPTFDIRGTILVNWNEAQLKELVGVEQ